MPQLQLLAPEVRESIARQIGIRAPASVALAAPGTGASLGESLRVLMLAPEAVLHGDGPLAERLIDTGQWHHQVYNGDRAERFARSVVAPGAAGAEGPAAEHEVVEVAASPLPEALDRTIEWADLNLPEDSDADLVVAPAYALTALWVHGPGEDCVVVAAAGRGLDLPLNARIEAGEFLERLAAVEPIPGLGARPEMLEG